MHRLVLRRVRDAVDLAAYGEDDVEEQAAPLADGNEGVSVGEDGYETITAFEETIEPLLRVPDWSDSPSYGVR